MFVKCVSSVKLMDKPCGDLVPCGRLNTRRQQREVIHVFLLMFAKAGVCLIHVYKSFAELRRIKRVNGE